MDTALQLKEYFFPYVEVSADPNITDVDTVGTMHFRARVDISKIEGAENEFQVSLTIDSQPESEENKQVYAIKLVTVGFFRVHPEWPNKDKLLKITGASMLYASAREFLITITARGPYGQIMLPTASFLKIYEENNKEDIEIKQEIDN